MNYLLNRKQRTKVNSKYSSWADISEGIPHGSILGPLLYSRFLCDLFIIIDTTFFASYAVDNTPYVIKKTVTELHELETVSKKLFMWFTKNEMMANVGKYHPLLKYHHLSVEDHTNEINGCTVRNSHCEKLLGVHFDDQLKFEKFCKNANRKLHALARVTPYMALHHQCLPLTPLIPSLPTPLNYENPVIESDKDTVRDIYRSLEEKVNLLNIKIIAMLILRQSRKDSTLQKSPCYHNSETVRLTEEMAYLHNENRTKRQNQKLHYTDTT